MKGLLKYYLFPILYVVGVILMEYYPNILSMGVWIVSILACIVSIFRIPFKKIEFIKKVVLIGILSIPLLDMTFDISFKLRNQIRGNIVFSVIDDSFATTKSITIREKNGELLGEFDYSVAGFGKPEKALVKIENDSVISINLIERDYSEQLTYNKTDDTFRNQKQNLKYRILENKLLK
jgi:hypothetical protein